jgi:SHS2 domain-containing protein
VGGHRSLPHIADIRIEAWAATREGCLAEAVAGLVEGFADVSGVAPAEHVTAELAADTDEDVLVAALDEVIYLLDTRGAAPVHTEVEPGGLRLRFGVAPVEDVELTGAVPKAVALHELHFGPGEQGRSCTVTTDV